MTKIFKLSIGELIIEEIGSYIEIFVSLKNTDYEFDYHKRYNADECRYFTTEENVAGAIDDIEERLCELSQPDKKYPRNCICCSILSAQLGNSGK